MIYLIMVIDDIEITPEAQYIHLFIINLYREFFLEKEFIIRLFFCYFLPRYFGEYYGYNPSWFYHIS